MIGVHRNPRIQFHSPPEKIFSEKSTQPPPIVHNREFLNKGFLKGVINRNRGVSIRKFAFSGWKRLEQASGFTLLEVLVALVLLGLAVTAVLQLFSANLKAISASEGYVACSLEAQSKMREILEDKGLSDSSWTGITDNGYRYQVTIAEELGDRTENLPLKLMTVEIRMYWIHGIREKALSLKTLKLVEKTV